MELYQLLVLWISPLIPKGIVGLAQGDKNAKVHLKGGVNALSLRGALSARGQEKVRKSTDTKRE
ncbi:MAG: hypothetical protein CVT63_00050 [Candidatus Anoxymicrobium japonicum]|uniref:Uncharacterized protein n=1 Tax=Candidatus Anoxymicrobium japonicum TaxID=2013648 RepID=A0A2N3G8L5_9ACTN|nr:MAG: hypothetical protein CVT63_00050 [Candidatus Anoxymicrobium japonicum]